MTSPLPDRNTSLPHPEARIGPDACITEDDISATRALARHRMSFLVGRERSRTLTTGMISSEAQQVCASPVLIEDGDKISAIGLLALHSFRGSDLGHKEGPRSSKDGDSLASVSGGSSGPNSPTHHPKDLGSPRRREGRRRSFIHRLTHR